ncbi:MAG: hypothetical protein EXR93_11565 [Gemmatimonadetes bacterium]|nr:hypothetical protein [Gemmatimonadota bacterium]
MTSTRRWLEERRERLVRLELGAGLALTAGVVLALFAAGVGLARAGTYLRAPWVLLIMWLAPLGAVVAGVRWYRRRAGKLGAGRLATEIESEGQLRRGSLSGVAGDGPMPGSGALAALADSRASQWLTEHGDGALQPARGRGARGLRWAVAVTGVGALLFAVTEPTSGRAAAFWNPVATLARARGPVQVSVDRDEVKRGERVSVRVQALGRASATLWTRAPGEPWQAIPIVLDSTGAATHVIGPLESDQFVRASAAGRTSETIRVRVALPSFLAELQIVARYPDYLGLADEPLVPGPDTILVPSGTRIATHGRATVPVRSAGWVHSGRTSGLVVNGQEFSGDALVEGNSAWKLLVVPVGGSGLEDFAPELHLMAVRDSAPSVSVPVPGADTTAPSTLKQPLVIDVRDDNRITRVELITRRVSHAGVAGGRSTEDIPVPEEGAERLVLQWLLDLNGQGFVPGDTAYFRVRAYDNAPSPQVAETREYLLRLPTLAEMREAVREASRDLKAALDSILKAQTALAEETQDAAEERQRELEANKGGEPPKDLPFRAAEQAEDLTKRQQQVLDRAEEMKEELRQLSEAAKAAGLNDPQFHQQIKDLQRLMDQAMTPEIREQLAKMRESLQKLDAKNSREQMQQMSESARQLQEKMERSKEMLERAAIEGSMTTLASDADDLAERQRDWNEATKKGLDSSMAKAEKGMATEADSLAARLDALKKMIDQAKDKRNELSDSVRANDSLKMAGGQQQQPPPDAGQQNRQNPKAGDQQGPKPTESQQAKQAAQDMRDAAQQAQKKEADKARGEGEEASQKLDPLSQQLRKSRDDMRAAWKAEVMGKMDASIAETSELAKQQQELAERMQKGDGGSDVRGQQAAVKEGMDKIVERLQSAAGKNALVSSEIATAMGYARQQMKQALEMLQQPVPNTRSAASIAGQAVTGLTSVAYSMLTAREDVQGAGSGSGFSEAVEKLANMAGTQSALAGKSGQLLPQMQQGDQGEAREQLRKAGAQQRRLADDLDRLDAEGQTPSGVEQMAEEARALAREMEAGQLNRRTVERQDRLYRRLLDAGRTLTGEEEDNKDERKSETAKDGNVLVPPKLKPGAAGAPPRFPYPTWEDLRQLSPEERRLILDYFRRLNDQR